MIEDKSSIGDFLYDHGGAYRINDTESLISWDYIYQNRDILVKVDKYGPVLAQALPPKDIMLFKRNDSDRFSKWQIWFQCEKESDCAISNFAFPRAYKPVDGFITYYPEKAVYNYKYNNFSLTTEIMIPPQGSSVVISVTVKNISQNNLEINVTPALSPYINQAIMAPWDKPEWYLSTAVERETDYTEFRTRLNSPDGDKRHRRLVTYQINGSPTYEMRLENYCGNGDFYRPDGLMQNVFAFCEPSGGKNFEGFPTVYAARYNITLTSGEEQTFSQVLTMQDIEECGEYNPEMARKSAKLLKNEVRESNLLLRRKFFEELFSKKSIKTEDAVFDNYVNTFLPLQMYWVACLDRGWPTSMRGVRDASNDFMGMMHYDTAWARQELLNLFCCQRTDGWMPRQISASGRAGKHDLREFVDGGAFLIEFLYEYLSNTGDYNFLGESISWLDSDDMATIEEHLIKAMDYYLEENNLGEHGLCKIRGGDWLDAVNRAGLGGRGESVTVTCQTVINLGYMSQLSERNLIKSRSKEYYNQKAQQLKDSINKSALNSTGFYNSVFTDEGKWVFSDCDMDGQSRIYGPVNYYAIISKTADNAKADSILRLIDGLKTDAGYRLFAPALGKMPMNYIGRIASGDMPDGLWENGNVYNHGSQGFLIRALTSVGKGNEAKNVLDYLLPYNNDKHPISNTKTAPYAILNCYQNLSFNRHRGGMPFLTGTIAMAVRAVYNWIFGIKPQLDGLIIQPCLEEGDICKSIVFTIRNKIVKISYVGKNVDGKFELTLNNKRIGTSSQLSSSVFISYGDLKHINTIIITFHE